MESMTSYHDDIYAWSQEQAAALRRLAETRRDLPNELDFVNIAEEIEDLGSSELHRVESFLELLLRDLVKVASAPGAPPVRHWGGEIKIQHASVSKEYRRSMRQMIDLDVLWQRAVLRADADLDQHGDALLADLPAACPFSLEELSASAFDREDAIRRLRTASGRESDAG